jgi:SAM-dependent methyltransferase
VPEADELIDRENLATSANGDRAEARVTVCAACGSSDLAPHMSVGGEMGEDGLIPTTKEFGTALGDIVRCRECGHMQLDRFPSEAELASAYADAASDDYVDEEAGQRESFRSVLERIERYVEPGALLDLGSWVGFLLDEARARGWRETTGVEPSLFASDYARSRLGLDVRTEDLFTAELPERHYDAVVLGDVLEHLTRAGDALDRVAGLLAPGGVIALELPDAGSRVARLLGPRWWSVIPTHIHYFTRGSAATMLVRHGYRPLYVATDPKAFTVRYYLDKIGGYSPALAGALVDAASRAGIADRMWTPDFRDRMIMIARGPGARA